MENNCWHSNINTTFVNGVKNTCRSCGHVLTDEEFRIWAGGCRRVGCKNKRLSNGYCSHECEQRVIFEDELNKVKPR